MKSPNPEDSIGFLVYEVSRLMRRDFDQRVHYLGLTQVQWRAIVHIARQEGCNQSLIADLLEVKPITVTRLIDRLVEQGWVVRKPDERDRRAVRLYLTEKARPLLATMQEKALETRAKALRGVSDEEFTILAAALKKIKTNLSRV
ncbi:MarR family winged helix-turn-helix transcriptional regulator [Desulforhopalus singaporensis]|uniref:DNA-binding transcriptional regulator, MarR family n=1 Tax=Desulforhopalus singaporensis TaxID=91360 RepID=A0A1H0KP98_9BACT|nr:MarR family transcriptional regulator [Desulforhopalus singaporensis]SDO57600.1 DNA-binding transcriptional regulator, MarR family [Desulforhopalus singaporensis]